MVFSLSEAGLVNFSGYLIANCGFPLARGYAKVLTRGSVMGFAQDAQALTVPRAQSTPQRLLFPYLTNTSGYESGIEIANTSQDPFGTVQSSGYCYLNFYGQNQPPALVVLTDSSGVWPIAPGTIRANTLSGLGLINFQGYAIATCNFGSSAGIAFVQTRTQSQGNSVLPEILTTPRDTTAQPLLFTSLSNQNGRDSAIVISNTSLDPFGTVSSHGTCGFSFYGGNAPSGTITTPDIPAGTSYVNSLSGLALVGFQGYMAASCNFGQARGWAYASDGANVDEDSQSAEIIVTPRSSAALTTLLFSAANSTTGVDTATTISNTSQDPFSSTSASGSCTLSYYGDTSGGGTPSPQTSSAVAPGGQLSFSLAQGNPLQGIAPVTGFNGYVIASCGFPLARGLATIQGVPPPEPPALTSPANGAAGIL